MTEMIRFGAFVLIMSVGLWFSVADARAATPSQLLAELRAELQSLRAPRADKRAGSWPRPNLNPLVGLRQSEIVAALGEPTLCPLFRATKCTVAGEWGYEFYRTRLVLVFGEDHRVTKAHWELSD